ncbi:GNAT family N-acetyltransferase [Salinarimonas sp. NSM]|uniref:GNAT family N-acetyltransferase n=1 Tax=Salinarimonas sp. NSM TaxID=3458003 RepID=UPI0040359FAB
MTIRLRPLAEGDAPRLAALERASRRRYADHGGALAWVAEMPAMPPERFDRGDTLVADGADGTPLGYVLLEPLDGLLYIVGIAVAPQAGRRGVGRTLMREAEVRASAQGLGGTSLATFREPPWNGPWFRRLGYTAMPEHRIGPGLAAVLTRHAGLVDMATRETLWKPGAQ